MAAVDQRGRVADRHITVALDWDAGTRLSIREHDGLLVVAADSHGVFKLTKEGYLRIPADARRVAGLSSGDRVLLTAHIDRQTITVFSPVALDELLLAVLPGGEEV
ncbi:AbrB/MazE/SpoVT family DNA-binding domain-containing protein [Lentzea sp. NPDC054927]